MFIYMQACNDQNQTLRQARIEVMVSTLCNSYFQIQKPFILRKFN